MPPQQPDDAWAHAGELLVQRRIEIDPRYRNRRLFAEERGLNWRLLHDIERAKRRNFEPETITAVEVAYRLVRGSLGRTLAGGDLEPLPDDGAPAAEAPPPRLPHLYREEIKAHYFIVKQELAEAEAFYGDHPTGEQAFPGNHFEAEAWDSDLLTDDESLRQIASLRLRRDQRAAREGDSNGRESALRTGAASPVSQLVRTISSP
jgi:hypothetical protein